jgi:hypothetical protein
MARVSRTIDSVFTFTSLISRAIPNPSFSNMLLFQESANKLRSLSLFLQVISSLPISQPILRRKMARLGPTVEAVELEYKDSMCYHWRDPDRPVASKLEVPDASKMSSIELSESAQGLPLVTATIL